MALINRKEIEYIAKLARLALTEEEIEKMQKDLSAILDYFNLLEEVDVSKVGARFYPEWEIGNKREITREDEPREENEDEKKMLLEAAPAKEKGFIKVKEILK